MTAAVRGPLIALTWACVTGLTLPSAALAQSNGAADPGGPGIYTCIDDKGRRLTSDRPIPECTSREQRVLNRDGSLRSVRPPVMTADERAEREAAERRAALIKAAQADAVRRDRNLISRYPNEAAHRRSREEAQNTVRAAIKATEQRVAELSTERAPIMAEAEFYKGKALPLKLRQQLDANDAAAEAQRSSAQNQAAELVRINRLYDAELERLKRLWAGAQPGSIGPATVPTEVPTLAPAAAPAPAVAPAAAPTAAAVKPVSASAKR